MLHQPCVLAKEKEKDFFIIKLQPTSEPFASEIKSIGELRENHARDLPPVPAYYCVWKKGDGSSKLIAKPTLSCSVPCIVVGLHRVLLNLESSQGPIKMKNSSQQGAEQRTTTIG